MPPTEFECDPETADIVERLFPGADYCLRMIERGTTIMNRKWTYALAIRLGLFVFIGEGGNVNALARRAHELWLDPVLVGVAPHST